METKLDIVKEDVKVWKALLVWSTLTELLQAQKPYHPIGFIGHVPNTDREATTWVPFKNRKGWTEEDLVAFSTALL